jgi:hypothetical protein
MSNTHAHLRRLKPTAGGVVSSAVNELLPPASPLAPAILRTDRLTGDRLTFFQVLLGSLVVIAILGAVASVTTGYEVRWDSDNSLVSTRPAGSGGTIFWCVGAAALACLGIARPTRRTARIVGWSLVALIFIGFTAVLATEDLINFDDLSFSKHTEKTGSVAMLQFAIGAVFLSGPVVLITQWRLFRRERGAVRS